MSKQQMSFVEFAHIFFDDVEFNEDIATMHQEEFDRLIAPEFKKVTMTIITTPFRPNNQVQKEIQKHYGYNKNQRSA